MERIVILSILTAMLATHLFVAHKMAFLGFYYLPILLAGYFCGKRIALLSSILAVFLVVLYSLVVPEKMWPEIGRKKEQLAALTAGTGRWEKVNEEIGREKFKFHFSLVAWGSFLVLSAIASSALYEQKQKRIEELRHAYVGLLEILTKYLELSDRYSVGRSVRVAELSSATARGLNLAPETTENIRIAALLHDLGHKETSALILGKSAELGKESGAAITAQSVNGQQVLRSVSSVLEGVIPIVNAYQEYFVGERPERAPDSVARAAEIIAICRAYDDVVTGTPTRKAKPPGEALEMIRASSGKEFRSEAVEAFEKAVRTGAGRVEMGEAPQGT